MLNIVLTTEDVTINALIENIEKSKKDDGMCLVKAAMIVRQESFKTNYSFDGKSD